MAAVAADPGASWGRCSQGRELKPESPLFFFYPTPGFAFLSHCVVQPFPAVAAVVAAAAVVVAVAVVLNHGTASLLLLSSQYLGILW